MSEGSAALIPALASTLSGLEQYQQELIRRLRSLKHQIQSGDTSEDLVSTLTFYIHQAGHLQRRMMLIHGRVQDLKRRSDRLKLHRAKQDQQVADWLNQEKTRSVPAAANVSEAVSPDGLPKISVLEIREDVKASPGPISAAPMQSGAEGDASAAVVAKASVDGVRVQQEAVAEGSSRPATPGSPALARVPAGKAPAIDQVAVVKRKGKRRVRAAKIE